MKKILAITFMLLMIASNCLAMTFSQPVKIGEIHHANVGGFIFIQVTNNEGILSTSRKSPIYPIYSSGTARFGDGLDALYFHYRMRDKNNKDELHLFGSKDLKNTLNIAMNIMYPEIFKINTNIGITLYLIHDNYDIPEDSTYTVLGRKMDGIFVKYFSTIDIYKKYFGSQRFGVAFSKPEIKDNLIIIHYERNTKGKGLADSKADEFGEFRFKWDDAAQWFGVEQVVY